MSDKPIRKTQLRAAERERRRMQRERNERLKWQIPLAPLGAIVVLAVAYFVFTTVTKSSNAVSAGVNRAHFQVDTEKLDLGDQALGNTVHASFNVQNTGDGTLTLNPARTATVLEGC
jgi:hypothetical protein